MGYTEFILTINSSCITILIILAIILLVATRFRGENGYAAAHYRTSERSDLHL